MYSEKVIKIRSMPVFSMPTENSWSFKEIWTLVKAVVNFILNWTRLCAQSFRMLILLRFGQ